MRQRVPLYDHFHFPASILCTRRAADARRIVIDIGFSDAVEPGVAELEFAVLPRPRHSMRAAARKS